MRQKITLKLLWIVVIVAVFGAAGIVTGCSNFGASIEEAVLQQHKNSQQFNEKELAFENRRPELFAQMNDRWLSFDGLSQWWNRSDDLVPTKPLPELKPNLKEFFGNPNEFKGIWFGHSTFLLQLEGKTILLDPVFSDGAAPASFLVPRFQPPVLELAELPKIDFIVISHDHYDHLDAETIEYFSDKSYQSYPSQSSLLASISDHEPTSIVLKI